MTCDECEECRKNGYRYCIKCGRSFDEEEQEPDPSTLEPPMESLMKKLVIPAMAAIVVAILINLGVLIFNLTPTIDWVQGQSLSLYVYLFDFCPIVTLEGVWVQFAMSVFAIILAFCSGYILYKSRGALIFGSGYIERAKDTPLYSLSMILGAVMILEIAMTLLFNAAGLSTPVPPGLKDLTPEKALFLFSEAAVYEEIAFRVVLFGVPMVIVGLITKQKGFLKNLGGGFGVSKIAILFLIISSVIFAYAHVSGWGLWKMFPVILGGLAMGFLYMKFGLYASIMFHMINDYMGVWAVTIPTLGSIVEILILFTGLLCIPILFKRLWLGLKGMKDLPLTGNGDQEESNDSSLD